MPKTISCFVDFDLFIVIIIVKVTQNIVIALVYTGIPWCWIKLIKKIAVMASELYRGKKRSGEQ